MKKLIALAAAVVFTTSTVGFALAQQGQPSQPPMEKKAGEKKAPAKKTTRKTANGTVKSASADSITVAGKEKGKEAEWTFGVDSKTKIKKSGKDIMAADVKAGDAVTVHFMEHDGKNVAQSITVKPGKVAKGAANPCAAKNPCAAAKKK